MKEFISLLLSGESFATAISEMIKMAGIAAIVSILLIGLVFFMPTFMALLRHIKLRTFVCIFNVLAIVTLFVQIYITIIIWLIIMIMAISGKTELQNKNGVPSINIISAKEDKQ